MYLECCEIHVITCTVPSYGNSFSVNSKRFSIIEKVCGNCAAVVKSSWVRILRRQSVTTITNNRLERILHFTFCFTLCCYHMYLNNQDQHNICKLFLDSSSYQSLPLYLLFITIYTVKFDSLNL